MIVVGDIVTCRKQPRCHTNNKIVNLCKENNPSKDGLTKGLPEKFILTTCGALGGVCNTLFMRRQIDEN